MEQVGTPLNTVCPPDIFNLERLEDLEQRNHKRVSSLQLFLSKEKRGIETLFIYSRHSIIVFLKKARACGCKC